MNAWKPLLLATTLALASSPGYAERVVLKNGEVLEGEIVENTPAAVRIKTLRTTLSISRDRIKEVVASAPGELELAKARDYVQRGMLTEARAMLDAAAKVEGVNAEALGGARQQVESAIAKKDLEKYSSLLKEARAAADKGVEHPALAEIRGLLQSLPADSPTRNELIDVLCNYHEARAKDAQDKVRNLEAATELRAIIALDESRPEPHLGLGDLYRTSSATWEQAVSHYNRALQLGANRLPEASVTRIYWEIGEITRQQKKWKEAATSYRTVFQRSPQFNLRLTDRLIEAMREYADQLAVSQPAAALMVIDEAIKARNSADLVNTRGILLASMQRWDESTEALTKALELSPRIQGANYQIALNHMAKGEVLRTRDFLQKEVAAFPNNYDALCMLGTFALERDDYESAEGFYTAARRVDGDLPTASLGLSRVHRKNQELTKAKEMAQEVLARLPEDRGAHLEMGNIYLDEGNLEEARRYFTSVLELVDKAMKDGNEKAKMEDLKQLKADALLARGEVQLLTAGPGTANQNFREALDVIPNYPKAYFSIGNAYRKKFGSSKNIADLQEAETNLIKARELSPQNAQYALELGILYSQELAASDKENEAGYHEKAVKNWKDYIDLGGANATQVQTWISEIGA